MANTKQVRSAGGQVIMSPVVLRITLTPEQRALVAQYTGRNVTQLEMCREELQYLTALYGHGKDWISVP